MNETNENIKDKYFERIDIVNALIDYFNTNENVKFKVIQAITLYLFKINYKGNNISINIYNNRIELWYCSTITHTYNFKDNVIDLDYIKYIIIGFLNRVEYGIK